MAIGSSSSSSAEQLLAAVNKAIAELSDSDGVVESIRIQVSARGPRCPPGKSPVLEGRLQSDGTIVFEYVCR